MFQCKGASLLCWKEVCPPPNSIISLSVFESLCSSSALSSRASLCIKLH